MSHPARYLGDPSYLNDFATRLYCICRKPYQDGENMMECEKCEEWFHFECIGYIGTSEEAEDINFVCSKCDRKDSTDNIKKRKNMYGDLFLIEENGSPYKTKKKKA